MTIIDYDGRRDVWFNIEIDSPTVHMMNSAAYTIGTRNVYYTCMPKLRTNIEIEDDYVQVIMDRYGVRTKTDAVDLALRHLAGQPMSRAEALAMRAAHAIGEIPADTSPGGAA
jgi:Arc/MetJ family transcription regulator